MGFFYNFKKGLIRGFPIALGYIPIAISYGLIAESYMIPANITILMSMMVFAGASQFIAISLIASAVSPVEIIVTTFFVNLRHLLMSASVSERIKDRVDLPWMPLLAFGITDETFSFISMTKKEKLNEGYIFGINFISYISWVAGTILGLFLSNSLPEIIQSGMGISLYAMFIALLIPNIKSNDILIEITVISIIFSSIIYYAPFLNFISSGWRIVIVIIVTSAIGAYFFEEEVNAIE